MHTSRPFSFSPRCKQLCPLPSSASQPLFEETPLPPFCYLSQPETLFIELLTPELSVALAQNALHLCYFPKLNIVRGKSPERHKIFEDVKASEPSVGFPGSYNHSAAEEKLLE